MTSVSSSLTSRRDILVDYRCDLGEEEGGEEMRSPRPFWGSSKRGQSFTPLFSELVDRRGRREPAGGECAEEAGTIIHRFMSWTKNRE